MSKPCGWSVPLMVILLFNVATTPAEGQLAKWNCANFSSALPVVRNIVLLGDASIDNTTEPPRLVLNAKGTSADVAAAGRALGLTTATSDGAAGNSIFAVEFDTSQDAGVGDPSASHMGVDIDGVKSTATYNVCPSAVNCTNLANKGMLFTKIAYNGSRGSFQVELHYQDAKTQIASWRVTNAICLESVGRRSCKSRRQAPGEVDVEREADDHAAPRRAVVRSLRSHHGSRVAPQPNLLWKITPRHGEVARLSIGQRWCATKVPRNRPNLLTMLANVADETNETPRAVVHGCECSNTICTGFPLCLYIGALHWRSVLGMPCSSTHRLSLEVIPCLCTDT